MHINSISPGVLSAIVRLLSTLESPTIILLIVVYESHTHSCIIEQCLHETQSFFHCPQSLILLVWRWAQCQKRSPFLSRVWKGNVTLVVKCSHHKAQTINEANVVGTFSFTISRSWNRSSAFVLWSLNVLLVCSGISPGAPVSSHSPRNSLGDHVDPAVEMDHRCECENE